MDYVIGIDSGGTHYRVRACDLAGNCLGEYAGATANHYYLLNRDEVVRRILEAIGSCIGSFDGKTEDCRYLVCGTTGLDTEQDKKYLTEIYSSLPRFSCPVLCINDAELALYSVTGGEGVLVISGTGSIAFGHYGGQTARVGGWALSIMGDEGSGAWVSRHALRHLARWFDGLVPDSLLLCKLRDTLGITMPKQLTDLSAEITDQLDKQPRLGALVDAAAEGGDAWARGLLEAAAAETMELVSGLIQKLGLESAEDLPVGIWGSNIVDSRIHRESFQRLLQAQYPGAHLCLPGITATEGATRLALERLKNEKANEAVEENMLPHSTVGRYAQYTK